MDTNLGPHLTALLQELRQKPDPTKQEAGLLGELELLDGEVQTVKSHDVLTELTLGPAPKSPVVIRCSRDDCPHKKR